MSYEDYGSGVAGFDAYANGVTVINDFGCNGPYELQGKAKIYTPAGTYNVKLNTHGYYALQYNYTTYTTY